jgi:hypothetical protein
VTKKQNTKYQTQNTSHLGDIQCPYMSTSAKSVSMNSNVLFSGVKNLTVRAAAAKKSAK